MGVYCSVLICMFQGISFSSLCCVDVWDSVICELALQRAKLDLPFVPFTGTDPFRQFGLTHPLVVQLLEQLPGAHKCSNYKFSFHKPDKISSWREGVRKHLSLSLSLSLYLFVPPLSLISPHFVSFHMLILIFFPLPA